MEKVIDGYTQLYLSILWYDLKKDKIWFKINSWEIYVPFFVQLNLSMFLELKGKYVYHKEFTRVDQSFTLFIILAINIQELVAVLQLPVWRKIWWTTRLSIQFFFFRPGATELQLLGNMTIFRKCSYYRAVWCWLYRIKTKFDWKKLI